MGVEYAPAALHDLFDAVHAKVPAAVLSGILGDASHTYGYHRARAALPSSDYSVTLPPDRLGDAYAAAALDISLPPDLMIACTNRLLTAAKAKDARLAALREFCGTTNGTVTHNYDLATGREGLGEWDDSHLWHVHLSVYRQHTNDLTALLPIADVLAGGDDVTPDDIKAIAKAVWAADINHRTAGYRLEAANNAIAATIAKVNGLPTGADGVDVDALADALVTAGIGQAVVTALGQKLGTPA